MTAPDAPVVVADVLSALRRASGDDSAPTTLWGDPEARRESVVVAWSASVDAIRHAAATGPALLLARVHPFFAPPRGFDPAIVPSDEGWEERMESDPVALAKRALLAETGVAVALTPWVWDLGGPGARSDALAAVLAAGRAVVGAEPTAAIVDLARTTPVAEFARVAAFRVGGPRASVIGDLDATVRRVAIVAGVASPAVLRRVLTDPLVDAVVAGETIEWEGTPYIQDLQAAGRPVALIALGTAVSEGPAADAAARRVAELLPTLRVHSAAVTDASWTPAERSEGDAAA